VFCAVGIRGEDAGTLVCYKKDDNTQEEDKARMELRVLGMSGFYVVPPAVFRHLWGTERRTVLDTPGQNRRTMSVFSLLG